MLHVLVTAALAPVSFVSPRLVRGAGEPQKSETPGPMKGRGFGFGVHIVVIVAVAWVAFALRADRGLRALRVPAARIALAPERHALAASFAARENARTTSRARCVVRFAGSFVVA